MESLKLIIFSILAFSCGANALAQDFVLRCSKYYAGSQNTVNYSILISQDRKTGFFVYANSYVYRLNLIDKSESEYDFKTSPHVSAKGGYFLDYKSISVDRQTLRLRATSDDRTELIDCEKSNFNVSNLVENIKNQNLADQKKKASEEAARKAALNRDAKF